MPLTRGLVAVVDADDAERIGAHKWLAIPSKNTAYAGRFQGKRLILMHRAISDAVDGVLVDHEDGNGLNNRRKNLRHCDHQHNLFNRRKLAAASSQYKGVSWHKGSRRWAANITAHNKLLYLGSFDVEEAAALAYNRAAVRYFGDFARLNEIPSHKEVPHANADSTSR